jgi:hypothetical protein
MPVNYHDKTKLHMFSATLKYEILSLYFIIAHSSEFIALGSVKATLCEDLPEALISQFLVG